MKCILESIKNENNNKLWQQWLMEVPLMEKPVNFDEYKKRYNKKESITESDKNRIDKALGR